MLSLDPTASPRRGLRWLVALVAASLAAGWFIDAARSGLPVLLGRLHWRDGLGCAAKMAALSVLKLPRATRW